MADRAHQLILTALSQSLGQGEPLPLHGSRARPGLFPSSAAGKQAAQRCQQEGWLAGADDGSAITDKGMEYLLAQVSPRQVLEDLVRALESRHDEMDRLVAAAQKMQASLEALRANAERVLARLEGTSPPPAEAPQLNRLFRQFQDQPDADPVRRAVLDCLAAWPTGANEDCPLTTLFEQVLGRVPGTTLGAFHDVLRDLVRQGSVYLHPWTGPLYELPEPAVALLDGHQIAYYASPRRAA